MNNRRIAEIRRSLGFLNQSEVAEMLGIPIASLRNMVRLGLINEPNTSYGSSKQKYYSKEYFESIKEKMGVA